MTDMTHDNHPGRRPLGLISVAWEREVDPAANGIPAYIRFSWRLAVFGHESHFTGQRQKAIKYLQAMLYHAATQSIIGVESLDG